MDLFSGTLKRPKLRPNRTVTEVDRDRTETETETWTEWCAKTGPDRDRPTLDMDFLIFRDFSRFFLNFSKIFKILIRFILNKIDLKYLFYCVLMWKMMWRKRVCPCACVR